jgi:hypothetical protein
MSKYRKEVEDLLGKLPHGRLREDQIEELLAFADTNDKRDELFQTIGDDVNIARQALKQNPQSQFLWRTFVRTTFAMVEGSLNILADELLEMQKRSSIRLTKDETEKLTEQAPTKDGKNKPRFISLAKKVLCVFLIYSQKMADFDYVIDTTTKEWENFQDAIEIRNRLTHPRTAADLYIADKQQSTVLDGSSWFLSQNTALRRQIGVVLSQRMSEDLIKGRIKGILLGK